MPRENVWQTSPEQTSREARATIRQSSGGRVLRGQHQGVGEEGVAEEHGGVRAVRAVRRVGAVARVGPIQDVIVDERGEVDQFDDRRAADQREGGFPAGPGGEGEQRAQALARVGEDLRYHRAYLGLEGVDLLAQEALQRREVGVESGMQR